MNTKMPSQMSKYELNNAVAVEVMHYVLGSEKNLSRSDGNTYFRDFRRHFWADDVGPTTQRWSPATDMNDAWEVWLRCRGDLGVDKWATALSRAMNIRDTDYSTYGTVGIVVEGLSATAICRAALLSVREPKSLERFTYSLK